MEDYREIGPPGNGKTRKTGASNLAAVRETTRHVRIHASRVIFRGALKKLFLKHTAGLNKQASIDRLVWTLGKTHPLDAPRLSQPDICSGDQFNRSFLATSRHNGGCLASLHRFGRRARAQARSSARVARY